MNSLQVTTRLFVLLLLPASTAQATQTIAEDVEILDATPGLIFNDTNQTGQEWYVRGRVGFFSIVDNLAATNILYIDKINDSFSLGYSATANGAQGSAVGYNAQSQGALANAFGAYASSAGNFSSALGTGAMSAGTAATAVGGGASASATRSTAIGSAAFAMLQDTIILGGVPGVNNATEYANIGIGTNFPIQAVEVERSETAARFQLTAYTDTANEAPQYIQRRARGTRTSPSAVLNSDNLGLFSFRGYNGTVMGGSRATITAQAAGDFTNSSTPTRLIFATTPVGQTSPQQVMVITPDGKVQVNGQNLNVPDYVFEDDYPLMPLPELRAFIDANGHLPGIASADEVKAGAHDLAGSDMAHLRKIEELTLYTLAQEERIEQQRRIIDDQQLRLERLERQMASVLEP